MKFLIILTLAIVAVSAKSVTSKDIIENHEFQENVHKMKEEFKEIDAAIKKNPGDAAVTAMNFLSQIDDDTRSKLLKDSAKTMTIMMDTTKSLGQRYTEVAELAQNTANLWKLAAKNYNEAHSVPVVEQSQRVIEATA